MIKKRTKKKAVARKPRKGASPKTRNANTMTESAFWSFIRSTLRQKSRFWKPILAVKNKAKRPYHGPNKRRKFSYVCYECKNEVDGKACAVHHIVECGSLKSGDDLKGFVERLFCEEDGLILLCDKCHDKQHKKEKE